MTDAPDPQAQLFMHNLSHYINEGVNIVPPEKSADYAAALKANDMEVMGRNEDDEVVVRVGKTMIYIPVSWLTQPGGHKGLN